MRTGEEGNVVKRLGTSTTKPRARTAVTIERSRSATMSASANERDSCMQKVRAMAKWGTLETGGV